MLYLFLVVHVFSWRVMERKISKTIAAASLVYVCFPKTRNLFRTGDLRHIWECARLTFFLGHQVMTLSMLTGLPPLLARGRSQEKLERRAETGLNRLNGGPLVLSLVQVRKCKHLQLQLQLLNLNLRQPELPLPQAAFRQTWRTLILCPKYFEHNKNSLSGSYNWPPDGR